MKKKRRQVRKAKPRKPAAPRVVLRGVKLGTPLRLIYRHANGGTYAHRFKGGQVLVTSDGRHLVIGPVNAKLFVA